MVYPKKILFPFPRYLEAEIIKLLEIFRVVAIMGPRGCGKTTLSRSLAQKMGMRYFNLDDKKWRSYARENPYEFIEQLDVAVIDEVQKAPKLIAAIKHSVDTDTRLGRFVITGSVDVFVEGLAPDTLTERVVYVELLGLCQGEVAGEAFSRSFLDYALKKGSFSVSLEVGKSSYLSPILAAGGYPESLAFYPSDRHTDWLKHHLSLVLKRDLPDLAHIHKKPQLKKLLKLVARDSAKVVNFSRWASSLGVNISTVNHWISLLEDMYLIRRLPPWGDLEKPMFTKASKVHFLDSGLQLALLEDPPHLVFAGGERLLSLFKSFMFSEILKLVTSKHRRFRLFHFRAYGKVEVDFVVQSEGRLLGLEVTLDVSLTDDHFRGLKRLRRASGDAFSCGVLFYNGTDMVKHGNSFYAMPYHMLWSAPEEIFS